MPAIVAEIFECMYECMYGSVWFTDEKIFTVATPVNAQNNRFYSSAVSKKDAKTASVVREHEHFSRSIMVSVGVSRMGKTSIIFVEPGAKINSQYYCNKLLGQGLLPDIRARCGRYKWTLQQDLTMPETLCVTCSVTMLLSLSQVCGHQTVRT